MQEYSFIKDAALAVAELVRRFQKESASAILGRDDIELEMRFGRLVDGRFVAGVSISFMEEALEKLGTNASCESSEWVEHHDFYYDPGHALAQALSTCNQVRTRVHFDVYSLNLAKDHIIKTKLDETIIASSDGRHALRVVLSRESAVDANLLPQSTATTFMRIQQRKRVSWTRERTGPNPVWSYDFSLTWEGVKRCEVEAKKARDPPKYEMEIELMRNSSYVNTREPLYIATSMLLKACDFFDPHTTLVVQQTPKPLKSPNRSHRS